MTLSDIQAVVWDFDGVINDNVTPEGFLWSKFLEADLGVNVIDLQTHLFGKNWQSILLGKESLLDRLADVLPRIGFKDAPESFVDYWFEQDLNIDERLISVVQRLAAKGIPSFLGTNQEALRCRQLKSLPMLRENFEGVYASSDLGAVKPNHSFFNRIQADIRIDDPAQIVFFDDSPDNVSAARALGWQAIHYDAFDSIEPVLNYLTRSRRA